jgi:hypothetical protein
MIDKTMKPGIISHILFLPVLVGCGGGGSSSDLFDCYAENGRAVEIHNQLCDVFNSGAGPLKFVIGEEYGPMNVYGEISAEGSGAGESLSAQGHLLIDIEPQSNQFYLSEIHIELSDFQKGVG